jgi:hypothetical protein
MYDRIVTLANHPPPSPPRSQARGTADKSPGTVADRKSQGTKLSDHWHHILDSLTDLLTKLKENKVPSFLICELVKQVCLLRCSALDASHTVSDTTSYW